jgi:hypothetical protein
VFAKTIFVPDCSTIIQHALRIVVGAPRLEVGNPRLVSSILKCFQTCGQHSSTGRRQFQVLQGAADCHSFSKVNSGIWRTWDCGPTTLRQSWRLPVTKLHFADVQAGYYMRIFFLQYELEYLQQLGIDITTTLSDDKVKWIKCLFFRACHYIHILMGPPCSHALINNNIYRWFVGSKHSHWLIVVCTISLCQITECSFVGRQSCSVMISELWCFAWVWLSQQLLVSNLSWLDTLLVGWLSTCWKQSRPIGWMWFGPASFQLARYDLERLPIW